MLILKSIYLKYVYNILKYLNTSSTTGNLNKND